MAHLTLSIPAEIDERALHVLTHSPFEDAAGSQAEALSGKSWKVVDDLSEVPIKNGWMARYVNTSGSDRTITAAGGCIKTKDGTTCPYVTLGSNKSCFVQGDGVDLIIDGDVS